MLASITPLGERGRQRSWWATAAAYAVGSVAGGATIGAIFGTLGIALATLIGDARGWVIVGALVLAALIEVGWLPVRLPTVQRQVNEDWLDEYRGWVVGLGFGYQLGAAVVTIITSASVYVVLLTAALTGSPVAGVVIGAVFGVARALPLLAVRQVTTPQALAAVHRRMDGLASTAHVVVAVGVGVLAVVAIGVV